VFLLSFNKSQFQRWDGSDRTQNFKILEKVLSGEGLQLARYVDTPRQQNEYVASSSLAKAVRETLSYLLS